MNVYEQIDAIFSGEAHDKPQWANEILSELKEIKSLLKEQKQSFPRDKKIYNDSKYYDFVKEFRIKMKANIEEKTYPTFVYKGRKLGIDFKGLLYDQSTLKTISKKEAFTVYRFAYEQQKYA